MTLHGAYSVKDTFSNQPSFARLAGQISDITTKCLLTVIVLVAGLGFARQVLQWWAADVTGPEATLQSAQIADGLGNPGKAHLLQFGDLSWSLQRQLIAGDRQTAIGALRASCREIVRQDHLPGSEPGKAESEFLDLMATRDPIEEEPGKWRLYSLTDRFPAIVGTRAAAAEGNPSTSKGPNNGHRIVAWGMATQPESGMWALYVFQPQHSVARHLSGILEIPTPPECTRTLSMRVIGGGAITAFEGAQNAKTWIDFYDRWFTAHNWKIVGEWRQYGSSWHGRYSSPGPKPREVAATETVDVHISASSGGRSSGLLIRSGVMANRLKVTSHEKHLRPWFGVCTRSGRRHAQFRLPEQEPH